MTSLTRCTYLYLSRVLPCIYYIVCSESAPFRVERPHSSEVFLLSRSLHRLSPKHFKPSVRRRARGRGRRRRNPRSSFPMRRLRTSFPFSVFRAWLSLRREIEGTPKGGREEEGPQKESLSLFPPCRGEFRGLPSGRAKQRRRNKDETKRGKTSRPPPPLSTGEKLSNFERY